MSDSDHGGKFEITREGIVHDMISPNSPHELTRLGLRKRLEKTMPMEIVAHTGRPDVEDEFGGIMRRPDVVVIAWADKDFVYGENVTIGDWTISTNDLPQYKEFADRT
ncbi:MAG: hypothetical protein ACJ736_28550 [Streptomyces sp.]